MIRSCILCIANFKCSKNSEIKGTKCIKYHKNHDWVMLLKLSRTWSSSSTNKLADDDNHAFDGSKLGVQLKNMLLPTLYYTEIDETIHKNWIASALVSLDKNQTNRIGHPSFFLSFFFSRTINQWRKKFTTSSRHTEACVGERKATPP